MTPANKNLIIRVLTAVILAPILAWVILMDRSEPMILFINAGVAIGLVEFFWIVLKGDPVWMRVCGVILGTALSLIWSWCPWPGALGMGMILATLAAALMHLVRFGELESAAARVGLMVFGFVYVPLLLTPIGLFKRLPEGADWVFLCLTVTWFSDTGAYAAGRALGKRKLYKAISPGKSIEGAIGGLCASVGAALLAKMWYMPQLGWIDVFAIAIPAGILGQSGDLVESMVKRAYKVKDSGWIIPGHGGLLDRIDALLFCVPYVYLYARLFFFRDLGPL